MYCKKCGSEIDNDSEFCRKCGSKTTPIEKTNNKTIQEDKNEYIKEHKESNTSFGEFFLIACAIGAVLFCLVFGISQCASKNNKSSNNYISTTKSTEKQLLTRNANNNDVEIDFEINLKKLGIDIKVHPNCDIKSLVICIKQYDKDGKLVETFKKSLGNAKEGIEITTSISLADFSFTEIWSLGKTAVSVYSGTVSYFDWGALKERRILYAKIETPRRWAIPKSNSW